MAGGSRVVPRYFIDFFIAALINDYANKRWIFLIISIKYCVISITRLDALFLSVLGTM